MVCPKMSLRMWRKKSIVFWGGKKNPLEDKSFFLTLTLVLSDSNLLASNHTMPVSVLTQKMVLCFHSPNSQQLCDRSLLSLKLRNILNLLIVSLKQRKHPLGCSIVDVPCFPHPRCTLFLQWETSEGILLMVFCKMKNNTVLEGCLFVSLMIFRFFTTSQLTELLWICLHRIL